MSKAKSPRPLKPVGVSEHLNYMVGGYRHARKVNNRVASNIRRIRLEQGLTQKELSILSGKTQPAIARYERKNYRQYNLNSLCDIAFALKVDVSELVKEMGIDD